jgi:hypothetical protein
METSVMHGFQLIWGHLTHFWHIFNIYAAFKALQIKMAAGGHLGFMAES